MTKVHVVPLWPLLQNQPVHPHSFLDFPLVNITTLILCGRFKLLHLSHNNTQKLFNHSESISVQRNIFRVLCNVSVVVLCPLEAGCRRENDSLFAEPSAAVHWFVSNSWICSSKLMMFHRLSSTWGNTPAPLQLLIVTTRSPAHRRQCSSQESKEDFSCTWEWTLYIMIT